MYHVLALTVRTTGASLEHDIKIYHKTESFILH